jgi:hypothetical protein
VVLTGADPDRMLRRKGWKASNAETVDEGESTKSSDLGERRRRPTQRVSLKARRGKVRGGWVIERCSEPEL